MVTLGGTASQVPVSSFGSWTGLVQQKHAPVGAAVQVVVVLVEVVVVTLVTVTVGVVVAVTVSVSVTE